MPAHFSGVFGIKPTFGRIPAYPVANTDNTSHLGPITRTVADAALMLETLAGPHPWDHTTVEPWPADFSARLAEGIKGTRIAWSPDLGHARVDPEVASLVEAAVGVLQDTLGANVEPVVPDWGKNGPDIMRFHWAAHYGQFVGLFPQWESQMDPGFVACVRSAADRPVSDYQLMRQRKLAYVLSIHRFFEDWDFMVTPAVSVAAFPADRLQPEHWPQHPWDWLSWAEFSYPFNLSGNPAAVVPCGFTKDGLPVGLQIIGRRFNDLGVMQAAAAFEQARPWAQHRPPLN
jgi:aspartyl-tRNA(Asn)/glutamyl-tRNA(Gln) amidotransferase subunit A